MKQIFFFIFIYTSTLASIKAQIIHTDFFITNDVRDLIIHCGGNEDSTIRFLAHLIHKDSNLGSSVWYSESCATGIPAEVKGYYGADKHAVSLKMKVFYWILQIFYGEYYSNPNSVCVFMDEKKNLITDMHLVDSGPWNTIDDIVANPPIYLEYACPESKNIESMFEEWMNKLKQYGLDYLRNHNVPPIRIEMWKLCTCQNISTCNE